MNKRLIDIWLSLSLKRKIGIFTAAAVFVIVCAIAFDYLVVDYTVNGFGRIMSDNALCNEYQEAVSLERDAFRECIRKKNDENSLRLSEAAERTRKSVEQLPFDYADIGSLRYAQTWSIKNSYPVYAARRDAVLGMDPDYPSYIENVYDIYDMQGFLEGYADKLMLYTLRDGRESYRLRADFFKRLPVYFALMSAVMIFGMLYLSSVILSSIIKPVERMASISRHIARNDYSDEDVSIDNMDEIGELAIAFNKMKHATVNYISALEDKQRVTELLHKQEVERVQMEKNLDQTRLDLLKSQINPHFLFNTLNTIACSARLEDAENTESMISSLSNIFRYNLRMKDKTVILNQELSIVRDYMHIQMTRFGDRISYDVDCRVPEDKAVVPSFTLQPLVENSVVHGISRKEEGGRVHLKFWYDSEELLNIIIADTGIGMSDDRLNELREFMKDRNTARIGIGFGNIYKRIKMMYEKGDMRLYSREGVGTVVYIRIPQSEPAGD